MTAEVLGASRTVVDAIEMALRELQRSLAGGAGREALTLASENEPLLLVVEDVNRALQPARFLERLAEWADAAAAERDRGRWQVLCPVWPRTIASVSENGRKSIGDSMMGLLRFTEEEGVAAVRRRRGIPVPLLEAQAVASALGYDPLLIGLHGEDHAVDAANIIRGFVDRSLERLAAEEGAYQPAEYRRGLRKLAMEFLERRQLEPAFADVVDWLGDESGDVRRFREVVRAREIGRLEGSGENQRVAFRHDRVRDHFLAGAVAHELERNVLSTAVMADPFYAELIGMALAGDAMAKDAVDARQRGVRAGTLATSLPGKESEWFPHQTATSFPAHRARWKTSRSGTTDFLRRNWGPCAWAPTRNGCLPGRSCRSRRRRWVRPSSAPSPLESCSRGSIPERTPLRPPSTRPASTRLFARWTAMRPASAGATRKRVAADAAAWSR